MDNIRGIGTIVVDLVRDNVGGPLDNRYPTEDQARERFDAALREEISFEKMRAGLAKSEAEKK